MPFFVKKSTSDLTSDQNKFLAQLQLRITSLPANFTPEQRQWLDQYFRLSKKEMSDILVKVQTVYTLTEPFDLHRAPELVMLLGKACHEQAQELDLKDTQHLLLWIKIMIDVLLNEDFIPISNIEKMILTKCVNSSLELLAYALPPNTDEICCKLW